VPATSTFRMMPDGLYRPILYRHVGERPRRSLARASNTAARTKIAGRQVELFVGEIARID
jgi:hypothetical protein